jgi:hypothetical protein
MQIHVQQQQQTQSALACSLVTASASISILHATRHLCQLARYTCAHTHACNPRLHNEPPVTAHRRAVGALSHTTLAWAHGQHSFAAFSCW